MKTKHLFYTLAVSAAFAACSQEEIVSQQEIANANLSNRPVVGKVALNFGEAESRGTVADRAFNAIDFVKGVDGFGARIIDTYSPLEHTIYAGASLPSGYTLDHAYRNYAVTEDFASSNYKYVNNGGAEWITDALMVEGNYMFYYPYNEANLARTPNKVVLPMTQVVKPSEEDGYRNPIKDLYEGENPAIVGYAFLSATDQDATVKPRLNHIFAYPQFTIKNEQTEKVGTGWWQNTEKVDLLIEKIEITSTHFVKNYKISHSGVEANLRDFALAEQKKNGKTWAKGFKAGEWTNVTTLLKNAVSADILTPMNNTQVDGKIVVEFEGGLYLPYGEEYSFNVVMPAAKYNDDENLKFTIYLADNKIIESQKVDPNNYTWLTYAPGKRFASEEYDYPKNATPTVKGSAGSLGTITLKNKTIVDMTPDAQIIDNAEEFEAYLASIVDNTAPLQEVAKPADIKQENHFVLGKTSGIASMKINAAVVELIDTYLNGGSVSFISPMQVEDAEDVVVLKNMTFDAGVNVLAGDVVAQGVTTSNVIVYDGTLTIPADNNNAIGNIEVKAGEVIVKENYLSTNNTITIGNTVVNGQVVATGKLTIDGEVKNVNLGYVTMNAGDIVIAEKSSAIVGTHATNLTAGTITVDGTLEVVNPFTVQANVTVDVNGTLKTTAALTNNGTITTDKSLVIAENNGTITPNSEKITITVNGGNGTINNTELAKVIGAGITTNTIYAEVPSIAFMQQANFKVGANINKIVVTGALEVETDNYTLQTGIAVVEFKGGSLYVAGAYEFDFSGAAVVINADTEWNGRNDDYTKHMKNYGSISVKADEDGEYYSFTYNGIAVSGVSYVANL